MLESTGCSPKSDFGRNEEKSQPINMKIMMNYLQMIGIIAQFDLKWPYSIKEVVEIQSNVSSYSAQIFSFDCVLMRKDGKICIFSFKIWFARKTLYFSR